MVEGDPANYLGGCRQLWLLRTVDFIRSPEPSRVAIDAWVSEETSQQIPQLLPAGSIDGSTRLVLTDAVYFHGDWQTPSIPTTRPARFMRRAAT